MEIVIKIVSVLLSLIMTIVQTGVSTETASSSESKTPASDSYKYTLEDMSSVYDNVDENGNYYPLVVVPGISHSITYVVDQNYDYSNAEDKSKPPIAKDKFGNDLTGSTIIFDIPEIIKAAAKYVVYPLVKSIIAQKDCGLTEGISKLADVAFSVQQTLPNGTFANNEIGLLEFNGSFEDFSSEPDSEMDYMQDQCNYLYKILPLRQVADVIGEKNMFFYTFSLMGDPMSSADNLDKYIDMVLKETGAKKVNLLPISLGGTIFTAFCEKYTDTQKVNSVVNVVPVLNGTQVVTDMFNRNFDVSADCWYQELFPMVIGEFTEYGQIIGHALNLLIRALPAELNSAMVTEIYNVLLDHLLVNTPQIWSMVNRESYPALAEKYLGDDAHSTVRARTDAFYKAQCNLEDNIKTMTASGIKINIIAGYSLYSGDARYNFFHLMGNSEKVNSDGVINIESTTLGATASLPGETLGEHYFQTTSSNYSYISPDGEIDASTGILPDNTWYFYNMHHEDAANNAPVINLAIALMYSKEVYDVHTNPKKFPQFNGNSDDWFIRRWRYTDISELYEQYKNGELDWNEETVANCKAIMYDCERVLHATIADAEFCKETTYRVNEFLNQYGSMSESDVTILTQKQLDELPDYMKAIESVLKFIDNSLYTVFSDKAYSEFWKIYFE